MAAELGLSEEPEDTEETAVAGLIRLGAGIFIILFSFFSNLISSCFCFYKINIYKSHVQFFLTSFNVCVHLMTAPARTRWNQYCIMNPLVIIKLLTHCQIYFVYLHVSTNIFFNRNYTTSLLHVHVKSMSLLIDITHAKLIISIFHP